MRLLGLFAIMVGLASAPAHAQDHWVGSWGASPLPVSGGFGGPPASFENQTIRQVVRLSAGGERIRLRLTNEYGTAPLAIGAATVAIATADGQPEDASRRTVTFSGSGSATIAPGAPLLSDPIDLEVDELETLSISLYLPAATGPCTCHAAAIQTGYVSAPGNFASQDFEPASTIQYRAFLSGVEVSGDPVAGVVVTFGDSITDGVGSTADASRRWPDYLAERLAARRGDSFGVVNQGISGNRVMADGAGESALARFDRDVLSVPGVTHVVVFEGVNDLGIGFGMLGGPRGAGAGGRGGAGGGRGPAGGGLALPAGIPVSADSLIAAYRQLIARAHAAGLKIYGATIAPYEGASYFSDQGEAARQTINQWIRESGEFDAVIDFDAVLRDPQNPRAIRDGLHAGDFLHGSDAGYEAMAGSIDLDLF